MTKFKLFLAGGAVLKVKKTLVMGILNPTPDSFSDGGDLGSESNLNNRIKELIEQGADIIDIGGESTRPGHQKVNAEEELARVLPVIKAVRQQSKSIPISIDTQKSAVADKALSAGASFINDISALSDKKMAAAALSYGCSIILMRGKPTQGDPVIGCKKQFEEILENAKNQDITKEKLILDPGLGFGDLLKNDYSLPPGSDPKANIRLINSINQYSLGLPVIIGASRKRFVGQITGEKDAKSRLGGSIAAAVLAYQAGAAIVRVHDVRETVQAFKILQSSS